MTVICGNSSTAESTGSKPFKEAYDTVADLDDLDVEHQGGIRWDEAFNPLVAVGHMWRNHDETALSFTGSG